MSPKGRTVTLYCDEASGRCLREELREVQLGLAKGYVTAVTNILGRRSSPLDWRTAGDKGTYQTGFENNTRTLLEYQKAIDGLEPTCHRVGDCGACVRMRRS